MADGIVLGGLGDGAPRIGTGPASPGNGRYCDPPSFPREEVKE
jgi:hypothetical protein